MLYVCEYSLHFFRRRSQLLRHLQHCHVKHPPGEEIYRNGNVCMFEVDGRKEKMFRLVPLIRLPLRASFLSSPSLRIDFPSLNAAQSEPLLPRQALPRPQDPMV